MASFSVLDYIVFLSTVVFSFLIGVFFGIWDRRNNTPSNYFLAGRNFNFLPAALSFVVTFQSSLMILGSPADVYLYGMGYSYYCVGIVFAYLFGGIIVVPVFHSLQVTSVYKYFELRYGSNTVRYLAVGTGILYNILYMSMVTYGTCVALQVVINVPYWATILFYTTVTTIYTSIGGIKAVIWTDVFQFFVMMTGIIAVLYKSTIEAGGLEGVAKFASHRLDMLDFRVDPRIRFQFWNVSFGSLSSYLFVTVTQAGIQRINSTPTINKARLLYIISGPIYCVFLLMACLQGVTIFAYYSSKGCDIFASGKVKNVNEIIPVTIIDLFQDLPGLSGLFIAALSSAALSTLSSCLSSLSAITYEDLMKVKYPNISNEKATKLSKLVVIFYGFISMAIALAMSRVPGSVTALYSIFIGGIDGPTAAVFILSLLFYKSTSKGMIIGGFCGIVVSSWLALGQTFANLPSYPTLPPGPIDQCTPNVSVHWSMNTDGNSTSYLNSNISSIEPYLYSTMMTSTPTDVFNAQLSPLQQIYTVSYVLNTFLGFMVTLVVGFLVSLCTAQPEKFDDRCLFTCNRGYTIAARNDNTQERPNVEMTNLMQKQ